MLMLDFSEGIPDFSAEEEWQRPIEDFLKLWKSGADIPFQSSGTSGIPKTILHQQSHLKQSALDTLSCLQIERGSSALLAIPADKTGGRMLLVRALVHGMQVYFVKPTLTPLENCIDFPSQVTLASFTPAQLMVSLPLSNSRQFFNRIQQVLIGGAAVSSRLEEMLRQTNVRCYETFGSTETLSHFALRSIAPKPEENFRCFPSVELHTDADGALVVHAPSRGLLHFQTEDVVELGNDNRSFKWLGRRDTMINSGGVKLFPEQIEQKLQIHLSLPFFVAGVADDVLGKRLTLFVEATSLSTEQANKLQIGIQQLPKFEQPRVVKCIPAFLYNVGHKLNRKGTAAL